MSKTGARAPYRGKPRIRFSSSLETLVRLRQGYGGQPSWLASRSDKAAKAGGASRDRTDDLKLAKLALSQLSYGPIGSSPGDGGPSRS